MVFFIFHKNESVKSKFGHPAQNLVSSNTMSRCLYNWYILFDISEADCIL